MEWMDNEKRALDAIGMSMEQGRMLMHDRTVINALMETALTGGFTTSGLINRLGQVRGR